MSLSNVLMPVPFTGDLILTAIVEGKGFGWCWMVGGWWMIGRCDRGMLGRCWFRWIQVVFMASVPFLSAGHGWIWFPSVPVVGFGYEKTTRAVLAGGLDGRGIGGGRGLWTSSIIADFNVNACIVIDQFVTNLLNFQPLCL